MNKPVVVFDIFENITYKKPLLKIPITLDDYNRIWALINDTTAVYDRDEAVAVVICFLGLYKTKAYLSMRDFYNTSGATLEEMKTFCFLYIDIEYFNTIQDMAFNIINNEHDGFSITIEDIVDALIIYAENNTVSKPHQLIIVDMIEFIKRRG